MAKRKEPLIWGLVLIIIGLVFILENMGCNAWDLVWRFWPVILIVWGAVKLIDGIKRSRENTETPRPPDFPRD